MNGKIAVVTGGARGIGRAICLALAKEGADIAFLDLTIAEDAQETLSLLEACGVRAKAYACNVADFDAVSDVFRQIVEDFGTVDILVNNAGITKDKLVLSMKPADFDAVMDINLKGAFNTIKQVVPIFCKKRSGRIVNISSVSGVMGNAGQANYSTSKAALLGLTKSVAKELASRGITSNAVAPGFVETGMTTAFADNDDVKNSIPMRRFAKPEEVAQAVAFLASDRAAYITGVVLCVDGGMSCH